VQLIIREWLSAGLSCSMTGTGNFRQPCSACTFLRATALDSEAGALRRQSHRGAQPLRAGRLSEAVILGAESDGTRHPR
jgi:hypothetical protein